MTYTMKLSIVIMSYNTAAFTLTCLESLKDADSHKVRHYRLAPDMAGT